MYDVSVHIGQAVVPALVAIGDPPVIEAEEMEEGRVEVVDVHGIFDDFVSEVVGPSMNGPAGDASSGEPDGERIALMISPGRRFDAVGSELLSDGGPAELRCEDDKGFVE